VIKFINIFNYATIVFLYVGIPILVIPKLYYSLEDVIINRELKKIYNFNFSFNYKDVRNFYYDIVYLIFGYLIASHFVAYALKELCEFRYPMGNEISDQSITSIAFTSLAICFAARYTSRQHGYEKGKQIVSLLFSAASIVFMINVFVGINEQFFKNISEQNNFINIIIFYIQYLSSSVFAQSKVLATYVPKIFLFLLIGSFITAIFGELILIRIDDTFKYNHESLYGFIPYFASGFEFIPYYKLANKMEEMTNDGEVISIRIISHTLDIFKITHYNLLRHLNKTNPPTIKIIAPDLQYIRYPGTLVSYWFNKNGLNKFEQAKGEDYCSNLDNLSFLVDNKKVKWVRKDLEGFRIIIVNQDKCLLVVDSLDSVGRKVGLYSENPDLIAHFIQIFDMKFC
jgi:hypothetical protein